VEEDNDMKDIFSYNSDVDKNAYMNWRIDRHNNINNMITIADGYMKASILLAKQSIADNDDKKADILIFPILFDANHAIELYLKAINWSLNILLDNGKKNEGNHDIQQIFSNVCSRVNEFEKEKEKRKQFKDLTSDLRNYIDELYSEIKKSSVKTNKDNMDFSRYPFVKGYINHFYIEEFDNVVVDLESFITRFEEIGRNLDSIAKHYLYDYILEGE
jgi:hypothetical protein